ncbi:MAG: hypothetical protein LRY73_01250 [Bacillus sp. (in: Bacteria)]|nr:hypothetical protein [Bacillus sp. (in: firmicutes)]
MKKKLLTIVAIASVLVIGLGAYSVFAASPGYDAFKEAWKNTHLLKNATTTTEIVVKDNGQVIHELEMTMKTDFEEGLGEGKIHHATENQELQLTALIQDKDLVIKNGAGEYFVLEKQTTDEGAMKKHNDPEMMRLVEFMIDSITSPLHDYFQVDENILTFALTNEEVPPPLRKLGELMIKMGIKHHHDIELATEDYPFLLENVKVSLPNLENDIVMEKVNVQAELTEEGFVKSQDILILISGNTADGEFHELEITIKTKTTHVGSTKVESLLLEMIDYETFQFNKVHKFH